MVLPALAIGIVAGLVVKVIIDLFSEHCPYCKNKLESREPNVYYCNKCKVYIFTSEK
ncbi:MAG: hypothetical protein HRU07_07815 [Nitrosopumilus sp.]|nr:hypothetical protein [Nitrosopumilus sp.]NRA06044.1 hypothetical protein [Nitrosopumilus sp.]